MAMRINVKIRIKLFNQGISRFQLISKTRQTGFKINFFDHIFCGVMIFPLWFSVFQLHSILKSLRLYFSIMYLIFYQIF